MHQRDMREASGLGGEQSSEQDKSGNDEVRGLAEKFISNMLRPGRRPYGSARFSLHGTKRSWTPRSDPPPLRLRCVIKGMHVRNAQRNYLDSQIR